MENLQNWLKLDLLWEAYVEGGLARFEMIRAILGPLDINGSDSTNCTLLHHASDGGFGDFIQVLKALGAEVTGYHVNNTIWNNDWLNFTILLADADLDGDQEALAKAALAHNGPYSLLMSQWIITNFGVKFDYGDLNSIIEKWCREVDNIDTNKKKVELIIQKGLYQASRADIEASAGQIDINRMLVDSKSPGKLTNLSAMAWKRNKMIENNGVNIKIEIDKLFEGDEENIPRVTEPCWEYFYHRY